MHRVLAPGGDSRRSIVELSARNSLVIGLPLSSSSVPVAGTLLGALLGDGASGAAQPATPAPTPTAGGSSGDSGGSAGNGGGSSGSGGGSNGSGGGSGGNGGGSTPTLAPLLASGGGTAAPPGSIPSGLASPTYTSGNPGGTKAISSSPSVGKNSTSVSRPSTPVHSGTGPSTATTATTPAALAASHLSLSQPSLASGTDPASTGSPSSSITTSTSSSPGKHQLSGGVIAGIAFVCFIFLLTLILVVVRHRSTAHRAERWRKWSGHRGSGGSFFFRNNGRAPRESAPEGRPSARSSFATNFDQGLMFGVESPSRHPPGVVAPSFPPIAEVRERNSVLISPRRSTVHRESMHSTLSNDSDPDCQYVIVPDLDNLEPSTPMSVRPFSPSESFAFPKPPAPKSSTASSFLSDTQGVMSPRSSATLIYLSTPPRALMKALPPSVSMPPLFLQTPMPSGMLSPSVAPVNPFIDPPTDPEQTGFADVEVIRRPYNPSLDDELAVRPGDRIRILSIFDDGWAFIEKLTSTKGGPHEQGLIPVDCLRDVTQALPTFLAQKRVTIYGSG